MHPTSKWIIEQTDEAIKQFGEYTMRDKGPDEVMHMDPIRAAIGKTWPEDLEEIYKDLKDYKWGEYIIDEVEELEEIDNRHDPKGPGIPIKIISGEDLIKTLNKGRIRDA